MSTELETLFRDCFLDTCGTVLIGGAEEPVYLPAARGEALSRIFYRGDYFASALHEVAHWCIAGANRRLLEDFGYWYAPDGRSPRVQQRFEAVEARPQALEWHFSLACNRPFRVSIDNLNGEVTDSEDFTLRVREQAISMIEAGLPPRGGQFRQALAAQFGGNGAPRLEDFN